MIDALRGNTMATQFTNPAGMSQGNYSHVATVTGGRLVFVSGQVAFDEQGHVVGQTMAEQAEQVFHNLKVALAAAGATLEHVVKMNIYMRDLTSSRLQAFRAVRAKHLGQHLPASTLVATPALVHEDLMLEVEVVAAVD
jgi:enamine deaminase RidA (YjgF/YER057c/UK114 family)